MSIDNTQNGDVSPEGAQALEAPDNIEVVSTDDESNHEGSDDSYDDSNDEQDSEDGDSEEGEAPKKKSGFEKRIKKLNKKISAAEEEAAYWRQEATKNQTSKPAEQVKVQPTSVKPRLQDFADLEQYTEALTDWKLEQTLAQKEAQKAQATKHQTVQERFQAFAKATPDFAKAIAKMDGPAWQAQPEFRAVIDESDVGPQMLYHFSQNKADFDRINALPPIKRIIELGKLEDKVAKEATKGVKQAMVTKGGSKAPAPLQTNKATKAPVAGKLNDPNLSFADWKAARNAELKAKGRR
jgi:hypothetical protein